MNSTFKINRSIYPFIYHEIDKSKVSIKAALAWFTDPDLLKLILRKKNKDNVDVTIVLFNDEINMYLTELKKLGSSVRFSNPLNIDYIMHHKFCIIDNAKLITGSYNWTVKARRFNKENIVCVEDDLIIAGFQEEFDSLVKNSEVREKTDFTKNIDAKNSIEDFQILALEQRYNEDIEKRIALLKKLDIGIDITLAYDLINKHTPVVAASNLANAEGGDYIQPALKKLEDAGRLDLCFEESIIRNEYDALFTKKTKASARQKLEKLNYFNNSKYSALMNNYA